MTFRILTFVLVLASVQIGCSVGPRVDTFAPALQPAGVEATLQLDTVASLKGELLEVQETAVLILNEKEITLVPYSEIRTGTFRQTSVAIRNGTAPTMIERESLRLLSRFPHGVDPSLLAALLAAYEQKILTVWTR